MAIEIFGFASVLAMVCFYAFESHSKKFVLAFSASCLAAATYAALIGSWPFAAVESIWAVIAFRRWRQVAGSAHSRAAQQV